MNDVIFLQERNQSKGTVLYYETALHELAHWTGHKSRLDSSLKNVFGSDEYAKEELIAEFCSAFLCADLCLSMGITNSAAYIQDWAHSKLMIGWIFNQIFIEIVNYIFGTWIA